MLRGVRVDGLPAQVTWLPDRWMWPPVTPVSGDGALHMVVSGRAAGAELDEIRQSGDRSLMYVIDAPTIAALDELEARCDAAISLEIEAAVQMSRDPATRAAAALVRERLEALRPPSYRRIAAAMLVTNMGNGMMFIATVWLVLEMTDHPSGVPLVLLTTALPGLLFGPLIGVAIDRFRRRLLFVATDVSAACVLGVTLTLVLTDTLQSGSCSSRSSCSACASRPRCRPGPRWSARSCPWAACWPPTRRAGVAVQFGMVTGATIGGLLIAMFGVAPVLAVNLCRSCCRRCSSYGVRSDHVPQRAPAGGGWRGSVRPRRGPRLPARPPEDGAVVPDAADCCSRPVHAQHAAGPVRRERAGGRAGGLGYIDAMFAVGAIVGGVALPLFTARLNRDRLAGLGVIGLGLAAGRAGPSPTGWWRRCCSTRRGHRLPGLLHLPHPGPGGRCRWSCRAG